MRFLPPIMHILTSRLYIVLLLAFFPAGIYATHDDSASLQVVFQHGDDPWASLLDSTLHRQLYEYDLFTCDSVVLNAYGFPSETVPRYPDSIYVAAFRELQGSSPMDYRFNEQVRSYIELYSLKRRKHLSKVMALSQVYFPLFESYFDQYGLPVELKYLSVIESALNPVAISRAGAGGLWQFMPGTGRLYGLGVTAGYDERSDPNLSTEAACLHLRLLYDMYGDWLLAIAAYNSGSGNVNKAIRRSGGTSFWEISPYLPRETRGYVPAFIAVSFVMDNPAMFNIYPYEPVLTAYEIDTVHVDFPVSFRVLSDSLGIPAADLSLLNPAYINGYIPASAEETRILTLPLDYLGAFLQNESALRSFAISGRMTAAYGSKLYTSNYRQTVHVVRSGESLGLIARRYGTTVSRIKSMNRLRGTLIHPGQRLVVSSPRPKEPENSLVGQRRTVFSPAFDYHIARYGETLRSIAGIYPDIEVGTLAALNNIDPDTNLSAGQKIRLRRVPS